MGLPHPRQLLRRLDGRKPSHDTFAKELAWRDFYADVLDAWPESAWHSWNPRMADMRVDAGNRADERFEAWCAGRTGFPIVDAGMRQLVAEGWMHNRVRMITASFLVKDLHVDWTRGRGSSSSTSSTATCRRTTTVGSGWPGQEPTGAYFRIFNPTAQGRKFDPDGVYVRRWVPERRPRRPGDPRAVDRRRRPPPGYPPPIVDHATEREESLSRYAALRR